MVKTEARRLVYQRKPLNVSFDLHSHKTFHAGEMIKRCYDSNAIFRSIFVCERSIYSSRVQWRSG